jgi:hypothetical protein
LERVEHKLLLQWMVLAGLSLFALYVSWHSGYLANMIATDSSKICIAIIGIYIVGLLHTLRQAWRLSCEHNVLGDVRRLLELQPDTRLEIAGMRVRESGSGRLLPDGFATRHLRDVLIDPQGGQGPGGESVSDLLNTRAQRIRDAHDLGWFLVDLMAKLGFLGTVIGFVAMLGSVADTAEIDVSVMQRVLKQMSYGMGTALYTTMAGLVGGLLLGSKVYLLGQSMNELLEDAVDVAQGQIQQRRTRAS